MFCYYHSRGLKMSNLQFCVEYTKDKPIANFVQTMTEHRKQATRDGNKELQACYKLVVNRKGFISLYYSLNHMTNDPLKLLRQARAK